jgi:hypothetical protein
MPISLALFIAVAYSTRKVFQNYKARNKSRYVIFLTVCLLIFLVTNTQDQNNNAREKQMLHEIAESPEDTVKVSIGCYIMSWNTITRLEDSELNAQLLKRWHITDRKKLYYYAGEEK